MNFSSSTANLTLSYNEFKKSLLYAVRNIVWKNKTESIVSAISEDAYNEDIFVTANKGLLNYDVVRAFPRVILTKVGISPDMMEACLSDKSNIPIGLRDACATELQNALRSINPTSGHYEYFTGTEWVKVYNESNNYYRELMGLPNTEDTDFVYNTDIRWSLTTPVHLLPLSERIEIEVSGVLSELIEAHPTKKYLKFIGLKRVSFATARIAERFDILYIDEFSSEIMKENFMVEYNKAKKLANYVYYNEAMKSTSDYYENFMAMTILFITIQSMMHKYLETDISRNFYDTESLKVVYDAYNVPYYAEIPLSYHQKMVKKLNTLISYKGSSNIFLELFNIFDMGGTDIYSLFLKKVHNVSAQGVPEFKFQYDEDGNILYDEDGFPILDNSVYTISFGNVRISENPSLALADVANNISYQEVISGDPYWVNDEELLEKIRNENFNFLETKYFSVYSVVNLLNVAYENAYIFRLVSDNATITRDMKFTMTITNEETDLFSIFMYLASIYCYYFGYDIEIDDKLGNMVRTLGYNYEDVVDIYNNKILTDPYLSANDRLFNSITLSENLKNIDDVNIAMLDIFKLRDIIAEGYMNAKSTKEFFAYRDLYNSLIVSIEVVSVYTDPITGNMFNTFEDVLGYYAPSLYDRLYSIISGIPEEERAYNDILADEMANVVTQIELLLPTLDAFALSYAASSGLTVAVYKLLAFFKSAKAELKDSTVSYIIRDKGSTFIKVIDEIRKVYKKRQVESERSAAVVDIIHNRKLKRNKFATDRMKLGYDGIIYKKITPLE